MRLLQLRSRSLAAVPFLLDDDFEPRPKSRSLPGCLEDVGSNQELMPPFQDVEGAPAHGHIPFRVGKGMSRSSSVSTLSQYFFPNARASLAPLLFWTCVILSATAALTLLFPSRSSPYEVLYIRRAASVPAGQTGFPAAKADTLVIYTYSNSDLEYDRNLAFFVEHGMWEGDGCEYVIIVQEGFGLPEQKELPPLPPNARYVKHENRCFDWGTFGWALTSGEVSSAGYKFIIFMNSSIRGPYLPPYWPASVHWSRILVSRLSSHVKLVGSTISCETAWMGGDTSRESRQNPHVQSYIIATDQEGLKTLTDDGRVFACYEDIHDTIWHAEVGSTKAILDAGYTIDTLMLRYQGVNWTDTSNWQCNGGLNPYAEFAYDGTALNPFEVLFVKIKAFTLDRGWASPTLAVKYAHWIDAERAPGMTNSNEYANHATVFRLPRMLTGLLRGPACFDFDFYRSRSQDLAHMSPHDMWPHFLQHGQFEGRPFRFTCADPLLDSNAAQRAFTNAQAAWQAWKAAMRAGQRDAGRMVSPAKINPATAAIVEGPEARSVDGQETTTPTTES